MIPFYFHSKKQTIAMKQAKKFSAYTFLVGSKWVSNQNSLSKVGEVKWVKIRNLLCDLNTLRL